MNKSGLKKGDEAYVSIRINKFLAADILISTISPHEVSAEIYSDAVVDLVAVYEALKAALGSVSYQLEQPHLKAILEERIAQLKRESEWGEEIDPPTPSTDDMPF